ncbi:hypothetical protein ABBQ32_003584 [Trebouxia sp. C0010 RCD-2024]
MATQEHINEQLKVLLSEDLKVISYKWLARKFGLPCNLAKQTLFSFLEQHRGQVKATYLLAGWTNTEPRQHTVQLVDSEHLSTKRSSLDPVTSMHVYSLQPAQPKDASELWNHDAIQTAELFQELRLGKTNCLADNRWSAVKCMEAKHDPSLAKRAPRPAAEAAAADVAGPSKAAKKPAANSAAGQIAGIMAGSAKQAGVATASVAVKGSGSSSVQGNTDPGLQERGSGTTATAPAGAQPLSGPASGGSVAAAHGAGQKKGGKSRLANMWSKAPAVKEKSQKGKAAAATKAQAVPAVDADAAVRSAQQAASSSDSDEAEFLPIKRTAQQRIRRIEEEEEEDEAGVAGKALGRQAKKAKVSAATSSKATRSVLEESDDEVEEPPAPAPGPAATKPATKSKGKAVTDSKKKMSAAAKKPPAKKPPARRPKASPIQSDEEMSDADIEVSVDEQETQDEPESTQESSQAAKGKKGSKRAVAIRPGPGSVKAGGVAGGPKRRKVTHTTINDRGEEVTEEVWEDTQEASKSGEQPQEAAGVQHEGSPADSPAANSPARASEDLALQEQPGNGVAAAGKSGASKAMKPSKPAAAPAKRGSSKSAAKDQRGIMSFFAKK